MSDDSALQRLAGLWKSKYNWDFSVRGGMFHGDEGNDAVVYQVRPETAFGFGRGETYTQTRWRF